MAEISMTLPQSHRGEVQIGESVVYLPPAIHRLAEYFLMQQPDRLISRAELIELLWPDPDTEPDRACSTVGVYICRLRRIGFEIRNEHGRGWRLLNNVRN